MFSTVKRNRNGSKFLSSEIYMKSHNILHLLIRFFRNKCCSECQITFIVAVYCCNILKIQNFCEWWFRSLSTGVFNLPDNKIGFYCEGCISIGKGDNCKNLNIKRNNLSIKLISKFYIIYVKLLFKESQADIFQQKTCEWEVNQFFRWF